jgi:hypothetical protein
MKKYGSIVYILGLACVCLISVGCATNQPGAATAPPPNSGHLLVNRVANFGTDLSLILSVDGKDVGSFTEGRNYDGYLSAGQHRLTANNPDCESRADLLLHRSLVGTEFGFGKEPVVYATHQRLGRSRCMTATGSF